jgi:hypothetical protein
MEVSEEEIPLKFFPELPVDYYFMTMQMTDDI